MQRYSKPREEQNKHVCFFTSAAGKTQNTEKAWAPRPSASPCLTYFPFRHRGSARGYFFSLQSVIAILPIFFGKFRKKVMFQHAGYAHQQLETDIRPLEYVIYIRAFTRYSFGEPSRTFPTRKEYFLNSVTYIHSVRYFIIFAHKDNKFI